MGFSAGGHLAALAGLTASDPTYQPGFESADTSVQACVPVYGVHDLLDDSGRPKWPYLASHVLKVTPEANPDAWRRGSPVRVAGAVRPPFLIVHGGADSLVRPEDSRRLAAALRSAGGPSPGYAELPGATHGFESLHSVRGERFVDGVTLLLSEIWARHRSARRGEAGSGPAQ